MKKLLAFLFLAALLTACSSSKEIGPGGMVETSVGKEFKVVLDANPSTGYHWDIAGELDTNVVELVSNEFRASEPVLPGSGGQEVWIFKAVGPGETSVTLGYYPPSNGPTEPEKTQTFTVKVK